MISKNKRHGLIQIKFVAFLCYQSYKFVFQSSPDNNTQPPKRDTMQSRVQHLVIQSPLRKIEDQNFHLIIVEPQNSCPGVSLGFHNWKLYQEKSGSHLLHKRVCHSGAEESLKLVHYTWSLKFTILRQGTQITHYQRVGSWIFLLLWLSKYDSFPAKQ